MRRDQERNAGRAAMETPREASERIAIPMAEENVDDGLLNQDDINAALEAAGMGQQGVKSTDADKGSKTVGSGGPSGSGKSQGRSEAGAKALSQADLASGQPSAEKPKRQTTEKKVEERLDSDGRPFDEVAAAMAEAIAAESASGTGPQSKSSSRTDTSAMAAAPLDIPQLGNEGDGTGESQSIDLLRDVNLDVKIELGRSRMHVEDVLRLNEGSVVELDKLAGDPVDVLVNGRLVARGEVLVLNDSFCVRINDIVSKLPSEELAV